MTRAWLSLEISVIVLVLVVSSTSVSAALRAPSNFSQKGGTSSASVQTPDATSASSRTTALRPAAVISPVSRAFDHRVLETAQSLGAAGVPGRDIRLPYVGDSAQIVHGAVMPGYAVESATARSSIAPVPSGIAYYGQNDTSGEIEPTTLDASSVVGALTVNQLTTVALDANTPDVSGVQLNAVITNVTLQGHRGYDFWTQNTVDFYAKNDTINLGEDTWNFSSPGASVPSGTSTILSHDPIGAVVTGIYLGLGPYLRAPMPFTLTLYLNSSVTAAGEQELWYNYTLHGAGGAPTSGNYDWLVFNSSSSEHPGSVGLAPFEASGSQLDPVGLANDFELDFGIGSYDGTTAEVLAANLSATLDYCPATTVVCTPAQMRSVPSAANYGSETGETSTGLYLSYSGTTVTGTPGPLILRDLWGYPDAAGSAAGSTPVTNRITVSGSPVPGGTTPYVFVFFNTTSWIDQYFEWAPDVPEWDLAPGTYHYEVMLSDYTPEAGTLTVGSTPTSLAVNLPYSEGVGVYTPLWAFSNAELAGISTSGNGSLTNQYQIFNNPSTVLCAGDTGGSLAANFFSFNDYLFPAFAGLLFVGTDAYLTIDDPVSFCVGSESWGLISSTMPTINFYLQIELISTRDATLANDTGAMGWPAMAEIGTLAGLVTGAENPFPTANVVLWNSSHDLVMSNEFVDAGLVPQPEQLFFGVPPAITCTVCTSPDGLLLYGGTQNTVWGNTFLDSTNLYGLVGEKYGGLAEAESGDLIYNNNFSADNPTVYLPFDLYNDSCGYGYAGECLPNFLPIYSDVWNVSVQPAAVAAETVNGVPLTGNVLGPACASQGGNYWNDYGNAMNPIGSLPFTNVYNYSAIAGILPGGGPPDQKSIRSGGDYAPLLRSSCFPGSEYRTSFEETGLASGTPWSVTINGDTYASTTSWVNFSLPNATYDYGYFSETVGAYGSGQVQVAGAAQTIPISFVASLYYATFTEVGLPAGTEWFANVSGASPVSSTGSTASVLLSNGDYTYTVASTNKEYAAAGGLLTVSGGPQGVSVQFAPVVFTVVFQEIGLRAGTNWSVTLSSDLSVIIQGRPLSADAVTRWSDGNPVVEFEASNGSYSCAPFARNYSSSTGSFTISGASPATVTFTFSSNTSSSHASGLPVVDYLFIALGVLVIAALAVALAVRRRRGPRWPPFAAPPTRPPPAP